VESEEDAAGKTRNQGPKRRKKSQERRGKLTNRKELVDRRGEQIIQKEALQVQGRKLLRKGLDGLKLKRIEKKQREQGEKKCKRPPRKGVED